MNNKEDNTTMDAIDIDADDSKMEEPGVYPQDDGTVKIVLRKPLKRGDEDIHIITLLKPPTIGDMEKAGGRAQLLNMMDTAHMAVLPSITEPQITSGIYRKMLLNSPSDTTSLMVAVNSFFI